MQLQQQLRHHLSSSDGNLLPLRQRLRRRRRLTPFRPMAPMMTTPAAVIALRHRTASQS
jgi:hypothetical protein